MDVVTKGKWVYSRFKKEHLTVTFLILSLIFNGVLMWAYYDQRNENVELQKRFFNIYDVIVQEKFRIQDEIRDAKKKEK